MSAHVMNYLLGGILVYYILQQAASLAMMFLGATARRHYHKRLHVGELDRIEHSPTTLPFSVLIPAFNEERVIISTTKAAMSLDYPIHEVIVVNDGSDDTTLGRLIDYFGLVAVGRSSQRALKTQGIRAAYASPAHPQLLVLDKEHGQRADALNAGANYAQYPLLCIMEANSVFESDALIRAARPFQNSSRVVAATGIVRPANGITLKNGRIVEFAQPRTWWGLVQAIEYLRSFQWSRLGMTRLCGIVGMSGAFLVVKRNVFLSMGGCDRNAISPGIELSMRLQRFAHENRDNNGYKLNVSCIPDPLCYTAVPESFEGYIDQRARWQAGTMQATFKNFSMMFNPRYGAAGLFGMPFYFLFETLSYLVEVAAYVIVIAAALLGYLSWSQAAVFFLLVVVLGVLVSLAAVLLEEDTRHLAQGRHDMDLLILACVVENLGFRQVQMLARLVGAFELLWRDAASFSPSARQQAPRRDQFQPPPAVGASG